MGIWIRWLLGVVGGFLNGFWETLDVKHWRKTVLVLFIILGFTIIGLSVVAFKQYMVVFAYDGGCATRKEVALKLAAACNTIRAERKEEYKEMAVATTKSIDKLAESVKKLQDSYIKNLEEKIKRLENKE